MGMNLLSGNLKRTFHRGYFFMMAISMVFMIPLKSGDSNSGPIMGFAPYDFVLKGLVFAFIVFGFELSKDQLQEVKISKKAEWFLANHISIATLFANSVMITIISTNLLLIPNLTLNAIVNRGFSVLALMDYFGVTLCYSILLNVLILKTVDMNRFGTIPVKMAIINGVLISLEMIFIVKGNRLLSVGLRYLILIVYIILNGKGISKERIVGAYF